jgi:hypothetical protein
VLVDDRDGRVLAELASARQAMSLLARLERSSDGDPPFSLVVLDHRQGGLTEVRSVVSMRPLPRLTTPQVRTSPDRAIERR